MGTSKYAILVKTVELSSLTKAADALGCTQSGASHAIQSLEEEVGFTLLTRGRSGARLTPDGERLFPMIRSISDAMEALRREAASIRDLTAGTIRVGTITSVAVHWLPGMIKDFQALHPQVDFQLINGDYHDVAEAFTQERIDLGFVALPFDLPECTCTPLVEDRLLAVLPKDHPLAHLSSFPISAIANEPYISLLKTSDHDTRRALELADVKVNVKFTTKDDYAIIAMVEQGLGMSIMPELLLKGHAENVRTMPLENGATRVIGLAVANSSLKNPGVQRFAAHIRAWLESKGAGHAES